MLLRYHPAHYSQAWNSPDEEALHRFLDFTATLYDYDTPLNFYSLTAEITISTATVLLRHRWDGGFLTESFEKRTTMLLRYRRRALVGVGY